MISTFISPFIMFPYDSTLFVTVVFEVALLMNQRTIYAPHGLEGALYL
jgi:hypothetical protein